MANLIKIKRSNVAAKVPLTTDLEFGELALNFNDGALYMKKNDGTGEIVIRIGYVEDFTDLQDTPLDYTAWESATIRVNDTADGLVFVFVGGNLGTANTATIPSANPSYGDYYDATADGDYTNFTPPVGGIVGVVTGETLKWDGTQWINAGSGGGANTFLQLIDTPLNYTGRSGQVVVVNPTETGLEFVESSAVTPVGGYTMIAAATAPSADGQASFDNLDLTLATQITLHENNNSSVRQYDNLLRLQLGDKVTLERATPTNDIQLTLTADAVDVGGNVQLSVTVDSFTASPVVVAEIYNITVERMVGGANTFLELTDTPSVYTGQAGKVPAVNSTEDALEFVAGSGGVPEAPTDGRQYGRQNAGWTPISSTTGAITTFASVTNSDTLTSGATKTDDITFGTGYTIVPAGIYMIDANFYETGSFATIYNFKISAKSNATGAVMRETVPYRHDLGGSVKLSQSLPVFFDLWEEARISISTVGTSRMTTWMNIMRIANETPLPVVSALYQGRVPNASGALLTFGLNATQYGYYGGIWSNWGSGIADTTLVDKLTTQNFSNVKWIAQHQSTLSALVTTGNEMYVTGQDTSGILGEGIQINGWTLQSDVGTEVSDVRVGDAYSMIIKTDGTVWGSGDNSDGNLGIGNKTSVTVYTQSNGVNAVKIFSGVTLSGTSTTTTTCSFYIDTADDLYGCGENAYRTLGDGTTTDQTSFVKSNISDVKSVGSCVGGTSTSNTSCHTIAVKNDGTIWKVGRSASNWVVVDASTDNEKVTSHFGSTTAQGIAWLLKTDGTVRYITSTRTAVNLVNASAPANIVDIEAQQGGLVAVTAAGNAYWVSNTVPTTWKPVF